MPQRRVFHNVIPWRYTWNRRIHDNEPFDFVRIAGRISVGHHNAYVVRNHRRAIKPERRDHSPNIRSLGFLVVTARRVRGFSNTAKVRNDYGVALDQLSCQRSPGVARFGITVQKHYDGTRTC